MESVRELWYLKTGNIYFKDDHSGCKRRIWVTVILVLHYYFSRIELHKR